MLHVFHHLVNALACELEVLLHGKTLGLHSSCEIVKHLTCLCLDHCLRNIHLCILDHFIYCCIFFCTTCIFCFLLCQVLLNVFLVLSKCIKLRYILSEVIVKLRKLFCFDLLNIALEYSFFASQLFCLILLRECNLNFYVITCVSTNKLLLESRDEGVGTKCQRIVCSFTALECLTIYEALEINSCCIAVLCCTILNCDGSGVFLLLFLKLSLNFLVCYLCLRLRNLKSFIVTK